MFSQKLAQQSLRRRMYPYTATPDIEIVGNPVLIVIFVAVAVQQPYAMRWSMTNAASPVAVALGNNVQKR